jgi:peptidoglycan/xylan/chitin deacetylase (PgdA/CDA1 family)
MAAPLIPTPPDRAGIALRASAWLHAAAIGGAIAWPQALPMAAGAIAANHLALMAGSLWPRSRWLGDNWTSLPERSRARGEVALTLDDGPDPEVTPRVLDLLEAHGARASFFVVGDRLAAEPGLGREILARGHTLENHSQHHRRDFSLLGPAGMLREVSAAQAAIAAVGGTARFFRAPAGLRNPFLDAQLRRERLQLVSWTRRGFDTVTRDAHRVHRRLARGLRAGDILLLHDGHGAHDHHGQPVVLEALARLLDDLSRARLRAVSLPAAAA